MTRPDLLVAGGGFAGLAAAARAAELGATVTVVERGDRVGGSATMAAGIVFTAPDLDAYRRLCPGGDAELGRVLVEGFEPAIAAVRDAGVAVSDPWTEHLGYGVAYKVDVPALLSLWRDRIEAGGGRIWFGARVRELMVSGGEVHGARVQEGAREEAIDAGAVLLATGGFQGDPELVRRLIGGGAERMPVRSNPRSVGDGLRMAVAAGAALSGGLDGFYGHLLASPLRRLEPSDYVPLSQYHSRYALLVNRFGRRFVDEARGDDQANQETLRQRGGRAVMLYDERVRVEHAVTPSHPHGPILDRPAVAREAGARLVTAASTPELVDAVAAWDVNESRLRGTIEEYGAGLAEPPFHALEVQPSITFTYGGVRGDSAGHVLREDGTPIPGLYVAGADLGGIQVGAYLGGLSPGLVFGPHVAEAALR